jgi:hypothetical protein
MSEPSRLVERIRAEYRAVPGLKITCAQAARLWSALEADCAAAFDALVAERFLWRAPSGRYVARPCSDASAAGPSRSTFRCPHCLKQNTLERDAAIDAPQMTPSLRCVACHRIFTITGAAA